MYTKNQNSGFYRKNILYDCSTNFIVTFKQIQHCFSIYIVNFEQISHISLASLHCSTVFIVNFNNFHTFHKRLLW